MPRSPRPLKTRPQEIARLYLAGHSLGQVAVLTKESSDRIRAALILLGVPRRPRGAPKGGTREGKLSMRQRAQLLDDLRSGQFPTMGAIACKFGVTRECVRLYAEAAGITRYSLKSRSEAALQRKRLRRARIAALNATREIVHEVQRKTMAALWQADVSFDEMRRIVGFKARSNVKYLISEYRKRFPADFPWRIAKRCTPREAQKRERARAAKAAAQRERIQVRRALLAKLWKIGATRAEISGELGVSLGAITAMLQRYRRSYPADFPPRNHPKRQK